MGGRGWMGRSVLLAVLCASSLSVYGPSAKASGGQGPTVAASGGQGPTVAASGGQGPPDRTMTRVSQFDNDRAVFELNQGEHHDHLVCLRCGKVEEFCDPMIEQLQQRIAAERGFQLREHALSMYGLCSDPACQAEALGNRG